MPSAADVLRQAQAQIERFMGDLVNVDLFDEWSKAANELYKEQFAKKENPYGEPWAYRAGDEKRTKSYYKFGAVADVSRDSFSLVVASANAGRSCVPFEPRGLGAWRAKFEEILSKKTRVLFTAVRP